MKPVEREIIFDSYVVAYGARETVAPADEEMGWEVYARMTSRTDVVLATECTQDEALTFLNYRVTQAQMNGCPGFVITGENQYVDVNSVIRVFVDKQANAYACLFEDITGHVYVMGVGSQAECSEMSSGLVKDVLSRITDLDDPDEMEGVPA